MMYLGVVLALALFRWEKKELHLKTFLIEVIVVCFFIFLFQLIGTYITSKLGFMPVDFLPEGLEIWIGSILILSFACYLSFRGWRKKGASNSDENDT
ncbi:hypothetical protein [Bacillus sp. JJ1562]|uniref:hypothetical protein n=1 Tax=Bacillus sp. JJ1562 TaxID=3122960 RepID=UPI0030011F7B